MAFDLDGVLIDSRRAVTEAYLRAGIVMPPDAWGKPASAWLDDPTGEKHALKHAHYTVTLREYGAPIDAGVNLLHRCVREGHYVAVVTHASIDGASVALEILNLPVRCISTDDKTKALAELADRGVYVDDQLVKVPPGWVRVLFQNTLTYDDMEILWTL